MRGLPIAKLIAAVIVLTVVTSVIMLIPNWDGEQASTAAPKIDTLLDVIIVIASFVFSIVMVMMIYSIWRWRAKPGDESDGAPIHGNTRVEIAWTAIPTVIVLGLAVYSWITLDNIEAHDPNRMVVDVYSQQYEWHFDYPETGTTSRELHVPVESPDRVPDARSRRHPLLLGPGVADQEGQRPGDHHPRLRHADQDRRLHPGVHGALRHRPRDDAGAGRGRGLAGGLAAVGLEASRPIKAGETPPARRPPKVIKQ